MIVGRDQERSTIERVLGRADRDAPPVLEIVGDPGIGKTTLLHLATTTARGADARVFDGRAVEFNGDLPHAVWLDALDAALAEDAATLVERLPAPVVAELAAVLPSIGDVAGRDAARASGDRYQLHRAVRVLLEQLGREQSVVVALDDVHWADPASIELIGSLARRPPSAHVVLVLAYRPRQAPPRLSAELEAAARAGRVRRLEVQPLTQAQARDLVPPDVAADHGELYRESGGNPFYLEQLVRSRSNGGASRARTAPYADDGLPFVVAASLMDEIGSLSDPARELARGAAVVGEPFDVALAITVAGLDEARGLDALDELWRADIIRSTAQARRFAFRHPLVRHTVYETTPGGWLLGAHRRAAEQLRRHGAPASARARHVEASAALGDEVAVADLVAAAEESTERAPQSAARWYAAALELLPHDSGIRAELLPRAARAYMAAGRLEESRAALLEAIEATDDVGARARLTASCATVEHFLGRHDDATTRVEAMLAFADPDSRERAELEIEVAAGRTYTGGFALSAAAAERAHAAAHDHPLLQALAAGLVAFSRYAMGDMETSRRAAQEALRILEGLEDGDVGERLDTLYYLGWVLWFHGSYRDALAVFERGLRISTLQRRGDLLVEFSAGSSFVLGALGRAGEALESSESAVEAARVSGRPQTLVWALMARTLVTAAVGELEDALATGAEMIELARAAERTTLAAAGGHWYALALTEAGQGEAAVATLLDAMGGPDLPRYLPGWRAHCYELLTRAELLEGRLEEAAAWADRASASAREHRLPTTGAVAELAQAQVLLARERFAEAAAAAVRAAEQADAAEAGLDAGRARLVAGIALARAGDRDAGGEQLRLAELRLSAAGAHLHRDRAVRELRRIGRRVTRAGARGETGAPGVESLSAREREVAQLVAARLTNREIAQRLYLSEKTVETHLRNVFVKLRVSSRVDVARALDASG